MALDEYPSSDERVHQDTASGDQQAAASDGQHVAASSIQQAPSVIFEGYRALGLVSDDKPFLLKYGRHAEDFRLVSCVGRYFYTFNEKLVMVGASHAHPSSIQVMTCNEKFVFTAAGTEIFAWRHGHKDLRRTYRHHDNQVCFLLALGAQLISIDTESILNIIDIKTGELISQIPFYTHQFRISAIMHPATYINKVLLGSEQGQLQLLNVRKQDVIYRFQGWNSGVTCIEQTPVINIVAIGLENGQINLHNLKLDQTVMSFKQEWGRVLRITFRTDGPPIMVSSSKMGHLAIWDIENRRLLAQMKDIHDDAVTGCEFMFQQPLLITSSADNSLKVWRFDQTESKGDLLYLRQGHSLPPTKIRFYSRQGHQIVSGSKDRSMRLFSIFSEKLHKNMGKASTNRKFAKKVGSRNDPNQLNDIIDFDFSLAREKEYTNLVALHRKDAFASGWRIDKCRMGDHNFMHEKLSKKSSITATSVLVTQCGNFVVIGYSNGNLLKYNLQSGMYRGAFLKEKHNPSQLSPAEAAAASASVVGLSTDELCTRLVSAQGRKLNFWNFKKRKFIGAVTFDDRLTIRKTRSNSQASLLAVSFSNNSICVIDLETRKIIREFTSHPAHINDFIFTEDCKWLICALDNKSILVYDLLSAELIDHFKLAAACTSLTMSPSGEFLATSLEGQNGIYLWANVTIYEPTLLRPLPDNFVPQMLDLPITLPDDNIGQDEAELDDGLNAADDAANETASTEKLNDSQDNEDNDLMTYKSPQQIAEQLITLSELPASRWKNLINIDLIRQRNRPKKPAEKPQSAPFFLPVLAGLAPKLDAEQANKPDESGSKIRNRLLLFSDFGQLLFDAGFSQQFDAVLAKLKELGPASVDVEIRSLDALPPSEPNTKAINEPILIKFFLQAILHWLKTRRDFELANSYLALLLKCHSDIIIRNQEYSQLCAQISQLIDESWSRLKGNFAETLCILNYIRNAVI